MFSNYNAYRSKRISTSKGIKLAEKLDTNDRKDVDILIGANYMHDFVLGQMVKGSSEPVAISSKLGWLISGPYISDNKNSDDDISSLLVLEQVPKLWETETNEQKDDNQEIVDSLQQLWRYESSEIDDGTNRNKAQNEDSCQFDIQFTGKRYKVSLPCKDYISEQLPDNYELCVY